MGSINIKNRREKMLKLTLTLFVLFLIISFYFYFTIKDNTYIGIRAFKINNQWLVKRILYEGMASNYDIYKDDIILKIDNKDANDNKVLNRWLIVENAKSIEIKRGNSIKKIYFKKNSFIINVFLLFFLIASMGYIYLFKFISKYNGEQTSWYFYIFFSILLFTLVAIIPSSLGNGLGRFLVILFISIFPYFLQLFLKKTKYNQIYRKNILDICLLSINFFNIFLFLVLHVIQLPYIFVEYLAQGIFIVFVSSLLLVLMIDIVFKNKKNIQINTKINLLIISVICFIPLIFFYIFPIKWEVPFHLVIPFIFLPVLCILHSIILSKLVSFRYRFSNKSIYIILSFLLSFIVFLLLSLHKYLPKYVLIIYSFLLMYFILPYIEELFAFTRKKNIYENPIALFLAVENERENISTYIHDSIIQDVIYSMKLIETNQVKLAKKEIIQVLDDVVFYLRELCSDIYPLMIQELGLDYAIISIIKLLEKKYTVQIKYDLKVKDIKFSNHINNFIIRSLREMMNNSILHGNATEISIVMMRNKDKCIIKVIDNGKYIEKEKTRGEHYGLDIIREKLALLQGNLYLDVNDKTIISMEISLDKIGVYSYEN